MTSLAFLRRFWRDNRGVAAVEMVLLMPVSVLMLFIGMEAGHFLYIEHVLIQDLRDAARFGGRQPLSAFACTGTLGDTAMPNSGALGTISTNMTNVARFGLLAPDNGQKPTIRTWDAAEVAIYYGCTAKTTGIYLNNNFAPYVKVYGTPDYPTLFGSLTGFLNTRRMYAREQAVVVGL